MLTFTRNTKFEVEIDGPAPEVAAFKVALEASAEDITVGICVNDKTAAVARFAADSKLVAALPPIGSRYLAGTYREDEI